MRAVIPALTLLLSICPAVAQDPNLQTELEAVHAKWFKAFDSGDVATMNQIETHDITLVMPDGSVLQNISPRKETHAERNVSLKHGLSDVSVRRFGDAATLIGVLTTESPMGMRKEAETIVFVNRSGEWKIASAQWTTIAKK